MDIKDVDENFITSNVIYGEYDFYEFDYFELEGISFCENNNRLCRFVTDKYELRKNLVGLSTSCTGGIIRFITNSRKIAIKATLQDCAHNTIVPCGCDSGFDLYVNEEGKQNFLINFRPENLNDNYINMEAETYSDEYKLYTLYFPIYNGVEKLHIGINKCAEIKSPPPHKITKPILFYGSSITQGNCASRPGNSYTSIISRSLDAKIINFGFPGNALGDIEIADMIAKLDISLCVIEYDFNAPNVDFLKATHKIFVDKIRAEKPNIPIIILSRPSLNRYLNEETIKRRDIVKETYDFYIKNNDKNIYFIDGTSIFSGYNESDFTVDLVHPNDLGFSIMAKNILPIIKKALNC